MNIKSELLTQHHVTNLGSPGVKRVPYASRAGLRGFPYWAERHVENLGCLTTAIFASLLRIRD